MSFTRTQIIESMKAAHPEVSGKYNDDQIFSSALEAFPQLKNQVTQQSTSVAQPMQTGERRKIEGTGILGQPTNKQLGGDLATWKKAVLEGIPIATSMVGRGLGLAGGVAAGGVVDVVTPFTPGVETVIGGYLGQKKGSAIGATLGRAISDLLRKTPMFGSVDMELEDYIKRAAIEGTTDLAVSKAFESLAPIAKKGIQQLVKRVGSESSEKAINYIAQNPEVVYKPATEKAQAIPSMFQQTYTKAFDSFKQTKSQVGKQIANAKQWARANSGSVNASLSDELMEVTKILDSGLYKNDTGATKLLNTILKTIKEDAVDVVKQPVKGIVKKGAKPVTIAEENIRKLGFAELDDLYTKLISSDAWKGSYLSKAADLSQGERLGIEIITNVKNKLYNLYDQIPNLTTDFAANRSAYKAIKDLERVASINAPKDFGKAFVQAMRTGSEDLFDQLSNILPKDVFDKGIAAMLNMSKKSLDEFIGLRGYGGGALTAFLTGTLGGFARGTGKAVGGSIAKDTPYKLTIGSMLEKGTGKVGKRTIQELLRSGTKQKALNLN